MRTRKNALVAATVAALSFTVVAPAQAEQVTAYAAEADAADGSTDPGLEGSSEGDTEGSWFFEKSEGEGFESYSPAEKAAVIIFGGIAAATAGAFLYGVLRTLIYNIAGV
ncbi:hypothetical protein [Corynebacterium sp. ED61]|uniref:hypothetical protein n=1 Tax=Corynebacterium sp. ED61 TaxID=2211360 RepID=UPI00188427D6|nr:hypothetical protein [Corynebacterium sp. ED61]MBF0582043.1 hypothetical protein [Corynebacterium sp. ED61]